MNAVQHYAVWGNFRRSNDTTLQYMQPFIGRKRGEVESQLAWGCRCVVYNSTVLKHNLCSLSTSASHSNMCSALPCRLSTYTLAYLYLTPFIPIPFIPWNAPPSPTVPSFILNVFLLRLHRLPVFSPPPPCHTFTIMADQMAARGSPYSYRFCVSCVREGGTKGGEGRGGREGRARMEKSVYFMSSV